MPQEVNLKHGRGVTVQERAVLQLVGARVVQNREAGLTALEQANLRCVGAWIEATAPTEANGFRGEGLSLGKGSVGSLAAILLRGNHGVALEADNSQFAAQGVVIHSTEWGEFFRVDGDGTPVSKFKLADGIVLNGPANAAIDGALLAGNQRAGILIHFSPGANVSRSVVYAGTGLFGLPSTAGRMAGGTRGARCKRGGPPQGWACG